MPELRPPDSEDGAGAATGEAAGAPPDDDRPAAAPGPGGAGATDAPPPPASAVPPPPPATPPPGVGETPPPPAPPPPVDLSASEGDDADGGAASPPLPPPPPAPPAADDVDLDEPREDGSPGRKRSWTPVFLLLLLLSVSVGAYFGFRGAGDDDPPSTSSTTGVAGEFITVHDKEAGFTVSYPESWGEIAPASGEQRLLVSAGGQNYFQVKVRPIDPATVDQQIVEALAEVKMITDPRQVELNGVKTYYFLYYTPVTEQSPVEGVHAHYFMINGDQLYTMVFQALPTDQFSGLAPTFDKVAESFQVDNPVSTPQTTAGATSSTTAG